MKKILKQYEAYFAQNHGHGDMKAVDVYTYTKGKGRVCFCAPHAVRSFVHKQEKSRDVGTGAIVQYLGIQGFNAIVRNKFVPKKEMISDFILTKKLETHFFLDMHGMKEHEGFDLAIGTGYFDKSKYTFVLSEVAKLCRQYKIRYRINLPQYMGKIGLTGRIQQTTNKANVLQLEFSPSFRDVEKLTIQKQTIPFLIELGKFLNNHLSRQTK